MLKNKFTIIIFFLTFLSSCQSIKDGLSGNKRENSDEFLVQKKNPLVLPPKFMELPKPDSDKEGDATAKIEQETNIEKLFNSDVDDNKSNKNYGNAEEFVLDNIK